MSKRGVEIDWSKLPNASPKPKRLHLEEDDSDGLFHCPVQGCKHDGFTTQRGCRKHAKNKHRWYQTLLRPKHANDKATKMTPMMTRLHLKSDELSLLTCQAKSLKISCPGLPAVVVVVKAIGKHTKLSAGVWNFLNSVAKTTRISHLKSLTLVYVRLISFSNLLTWCKMSGISGMQGA